MTETRKLPAFAKAAMGVQAFLLQRNWMGGMGNVLMVITTTGRKSGKPFSTPIGYIRDGNDFVSLNPHGTSNWYKNVLANPDVKLNVKGQNYEARGEHITNQQEKERLFEIFKRDHAAAFPRLFGVSVDAPTDQLAKALASREMIRFRLK